VECLDDGLELGDDLGLDRGLDGVDQLVLALGRVVEGLGRLERRVDDGEAGKRNIVLILLLGQP